jgi:rRNA maturation protein Nop10
MLPRTVTCEDCGEKAFVRAYGRVEYDWSPDEPEHGQIATKPRIKLLRLTIDCPKCGVKTQDIHPRSEFDI